MLFQRVRYEASFLGHNDLSGEGVVIHIDKDDELEPGRHPLCVVVRTDDGRIVHTYSDDCDIIGTTAERQVYDDLRFVHEWMQTADKEAIEYLAPELAALAEKLCEVKLLVELKKHYRRVFLADLPDEQEAGLLKDEARAHRTRATSDRDITFWGTRVAFYRKLREYYNGQVGIGSVQAALDIVVSHRQ